MDGLNITLKKYGVQQKTLNDVIKKANKLKGKILAIGITNQRKQL